MAKRPGMRCPRFPDCRPFPGGRRPIIINDTRSMSNETSLPGDDEELELWISIINQFVSPVIYVIAIY